MTLQWTEIQDGVQVAELPGKSGIALRVSHGLELIVTVVLFPNGLMNLAKFLEKITE
jgi:hypothetical protein